MNTNEVHQEYLSKVAVLHRSTKEAMTDFTRVHHTKN